MSAEEGKLGMPNAALTALERFVAENDELLDLESRIGKFNIFDALRITHVEIRHSNFLAFLLDPAESHGQGQLFLKAVLMDLLKKAPLNLRRALKPQLSPIDLDGADMRCVQVKREWKHTDLLIRCKEPPIVVVIENKIRSKEGPDQLSRYEETMEKDYPGALYVYLTLNADEPSRDAWMPYSHADIHRVLTRVRESYGNTIGDDVLVFLDHYLSLLGTRFMNDEKIDDLCQRIYKNHRAALDLIWERVGTPTSGVIAEAGTVLEEDVRWEVVARPKNRIHFVPKEWLTWLPQLAKGTLRSWIYVNFFISDEGALDYLVGIAPMKDPEKHREIVQKLRERLKTCPDYELKPHAKPAKEVKNNRAPITGRETILEWSDDNEPGSEEIREP